MRFLLVHCLATNHRTQKMNYTFLSRQNDDIIFYGDKDGSSISFEEIGGEDVGRLVWNGVSALPGGAIALESIDRYSYGRFSARLKSPDTSNQPNAGVVSSFFAYFDPRDNSDLDRNGLPDISEIDFEFLGAAPSEIHLTAHIAAGSEGGESTTKCIDLDAGTVQYTRHVRRKDGSTVTTDLPNTEKPRIEGYSNLDWHTFGFDYHKKHIVFWIEHEGKRLTLWELKNHIPMYPMYILGNLWWTDGWYPGDRVECVEKPLNSPSLLYQWVAWEPIDEPDKETNMVAIIAPIVAVLVIAGIAIVGILIYRNKKASSNSTASTSINV